MIHSVGRDRNSLHEPKRLPEILEFKMRCRFPFTNRQPSSFLSPAATSCFDNFPLVIGIPYLTAPSV
jgi:hypothetical protein